MAINKIAVFGGIGLLALFGIVIYYQSQRRVSAGVEYDLAPAGNVFGWSPSNTNQPSTGSTSTGTSTGGTARQAVSIYVEPAKSLIAQRAEIFATSPITLSNIKTAISAGTPIFNGVSPAIADKIKVKFQQVFGINPESYISYPLWTRKENPDLLPQLKSKTAPLSTWNRVGATSYGNYGTLSQYWTVAAWGIDFSTLNAGTPAQFAPSVQRFFNNCIVEIERIEAAVTIQAIEFLRLPANGGYRFLEYGDTNA